MSGEILVLAEHRGGEIREITGEMLGLGRRLADERGARLTALLLGQGVHGMADRLAGRADRVEVIEGESFSQFNSDAYHGALAPMIRERAPLLVLIGQTSYGIDLAPGLATDLGLPLITDVTKLTLENQSVVAERPVYGGKAMARVRSQGPRAIVTVQSGAFSAAPEGAQPGEIVSVQGGSTPPERKRFAGFIDAPVADVDITRSDVVVSVGRGIGEPDNIPMVEGLAAALGAVLACSRPVVDRKWLPKSRQVGISGKTVAPKLYLAIGISGAFQHLAGIKKAGTVVAINKDANAPIFRVADYGVVGDLFTLVPKLTERIKEMKKRGA